jgi:hypothetical protein
MSLKQINLTIPGDRTLDIADFSPEENFLMLKIGSSCLIEGRKVVSNLTQKEIYQKIKDESKEEVKTLEMNLLVQKELTTQMEEKMNKMYELRINQLNKQLELMRQQLKTYEVDNKEIVEKEVNKAREKYEWLLEEKDRQNQLNREVFDKAIQLTNKSTSHKGSDGEKTFSEYASTFQDFKGFEIIDKHTQGGQGDFHLHFEEFDILVDAKNYKKKVPVEQRDKIKKDLLKNEHIQFAWLVSLNTAIDKWDKAPIMYEWINTSQCIIYINNLACFEDPQKILRIVWFTCKELYKLIKEVNVDETELTDLKERQFKLLDKIKDIKKNIRELNTSINSTKNIVQLMDDQLKDILELEATNIINSKFAMFDNWWDENIELVSENCSELSTDLWQRFKTDNRDVIKELEITVDKFKQYLKSKVPFSSLVIKSKNANSAFDIKGIKLKNVDSVVVSVEVEDEKMVVELEEEVVKSKKVKKTKRDNYFDEELDSNILTAYQDVKNNIINLSNSYNVRPWEIVSLLVKHKVIVKRDEARGYDRYKETEEYKTKLNT